MITRFKDNDFNLIYNQWVSIDVPTLRKVLNPGSNREEAFRIGYIGHKQVPNRRSLLYAIYVAGKEWDKHNSVCHCVTSPKNEKNCPVHWEQYDDRQIRKEMADSFSSYPC